MKVELFIHGVPNGEGFWGQQEDRNYFATFYDRSADEVKFLVQYRLSKGKPYCYYNYLVYKTPGSPTPNVVANDGRDGSYFGISLRLDAYCKDVMNMFRILDTIYNIYVYGDFLKMEKSKLRYTFSDFSNVATKLKTIETETIKLIQQGFYADSFTSLEGFATNSNKTASYNLYDMSSEEVMQVMKQYGKITLSPYYPTKREQQIQKRCESDIAAIKQQCEQDKSALGATLSPLKSQVSSLQQEVAERDKSIALLQQEVKKDGKVKHISQLVSTLRDPVAELSRTLHAIAPNSNGKRNGGKMAASQSSVLKMVAMYVPIANLILLVVLVFMFLGLGKKVVSSVANTQIPMGITIGDATDDASLMNETPQDMASGTDGENEQPEETVSPFRQEVNPTAE